MSPNADLLTRREAATYLRVSRSWLIAGNGPTVIKVGGKRFYSRADCDAFLLRCREQSIQEAECRSTNNESPKFGGASSMSRVTRSRSGSALAQRLDGMLSQKSAGSELNTSNEPEKPKAA